MEHEELLIDNRIVIRPKAFDVKSQGLFFHVSPFERRILGMLISEVGEDRYKDFIRIAHKDEFNNAGYAPKKEIYFSETDQDIAYCIPTEITEHNEISRRRKIQSERNKTLNQLDRMMRSNYNKYK